MTYESLQNLQNIWQHLSTGILSPILLAYHYSGSSVFMLALLMTLIWAASVTISLKIILMLLGVRFKSWHSNGYLPGTKNFSSTCWPVLVILVVLHVLQANMDSVRRRGIWAHGDMYHTDWHHRLFTLHWFGREVLCLYVRFACLFSILLFIIMWKSFLLTFFKHICIEMSSSKLLQSLRNMSTL